MFSHMGLGAIASTALPIKKGVIRFKKEYMIIREKL